jgi:hypothetical protein
VSLDPVSWRPQSVGERRLAHRLSGLGGAVISLAGLSAPESRGTIDHLVVGPAGLYVIATSHARNAAVDIQRTQPAGTTAPRERLVVGGRDRTRLSTALRAQAAAVRNVLEAGRQFSQVPVVAVLCFVDAQFPLFATLEINGVRVLRLAGTTKLVVSPGPFGPGARQAIANQLGRSLGPNGEN